jgi:hypothetical protein
MDRAGADMVAFGSERESSIRKELIMGSSGSGNEGDRTIKNMQKQIDDLNNALALIAQGTSIHDAIGNGFAGIAEMLEPLRVLRPARGSLSKDELAKLKSIRLTLRRPDYSDIEDNDDEINSKTSKKTRAGEAS